MHIRRLAFALAGALSALACWCAPALAASSYKGVCAELGVELGGEPPFCTSFPNMNQPDMVAVSDAAGVTNGDVYVASVGGVEASEHSSITRFNAKGEPVDFTGSNAQIDGNQLLFPTGAVRGVAVESATGDFYVTNDETEKIERFDAEGALIGSFALPEAAAKEKAMFGIAVDESSDASKGDIYVVNGPEVVARDAVYRFVPNGGTFESPEAPFIPSSSLYNPQSVAVGHAGAVYVANHNGAVKKFNSATGAAESVTFGKGEGAEAVATDPSTGHEHVFVWAKGASEGEPHVLVYKETSSTKIEEFETPGFGAATEEALIPAGLAVNPSTHEVYATNPKYGATSDSGAIFSTSVVAKGLRVVTEPATGVSKTGATLHATILAPAGEEVKYRFAWGGKESASTGEVTVPAGGEAKVEEKIVSGLEANATYQYKALAEHGSELEEGETDEFTASAFTVETEPATEVTKTGATLHAKIELAGGGMVKYRFDYGESEAYGSVSEEKEVDVPASGEAEVSAPVSGLAKRGQVYDFKAVGEYVQESETAEGGNLTFETEAGLGVETEAATGVSMTEATLRAKVSLPGGGMVRYRFEYGETELYGAATATGEVEVPAGGEATVEATITGLKAGADGTTYYFDALAEYESETAEGELPLTFTTLPELKMPEAKTGPAEDVGPAHAKLTGEANPGGEGEYHFEYGTEACATAKTPCETTAKTKIVGSTKAAVAPVEVTGLASGDTYHYQLVVENGYAGHTVVPGGEATFKAEAQPPETPLAGVASAIAMTTATLEGGVLNPGGEGKPGEYEYRYSQSASECEGGQRTPLQPAAGKQDEATQPVRLTGLTPGAEYTFCLIERNLDGEYSPLSAPGHFTTLAAAPTIAEESVTNVTDKSATLHAKVDPGGAATTYEFQYAPAGGQFEPVVEPEGRGVGTLPAGTSAAPVEVVDEGLSPDSSYEFRVVVGNSVASGVDGEAVAFATWSSSTAFALPDDRAYELVSPAQKLGAWFEDTGYSWVVRAAGDGAAISYPSNAPTNGESSGYALNAQVLSRRGSSGWESRDLGVPHETAAAGAPQNGDEYRAFSEDLSRAVVQPQGPFTPCLSALGAPQPCLSEAASEQTAFSQDLGTGLFTPLVTGCPAAGAPCAQAVRAAADVPAGTVFGDVVSEELAGEECGAADKLCGPYFVAGTPDLSHVVLRSFAGLTAGSESSAGGLYEWSAGKLAFVGYGEENHKYAGEYAARGEHGISADGSRVIFAGSSTNGDGEEVSGLLLRDTVRGEAIAIGPASESFQDASADDSRVFFGGNGGLKSPGRLSVFELTSRPGEPLKGHTTVLANGQEGVVLGASATGCDVEPGEGEEGNDCFVYFVSTEALAPGAQAGQDNLYADHYENGAWTPTLVTILSAADRNDWDDTGGFNTGSELQFESLEHQPARVSPNGRWLAFMAQEALTGAAGGGAPVAEVYLYHAQTGGSAATLTCASCEPTGARPVGVQYSQAVNTIDDGRQEAWPTGALVAAAVPGWYAPEIELDWQGHQPRYLSDSGRLFFNSYDALVPDDVNGTWDVYEYEPAGVGAEQHGAERGCSSASTSGSVVYRPGHKFTAQALAGEEAAGCVALISSGSSSAPSAFLEASETGGDVFFLTASALVSQDTNMAYDVYDAHECTGASPCPSAALAPAPCDTEASCKPAPQPQPSLYGPAPSQTFSGPGNLTPLPATVPEPKVETRAEKLAKALKGCRKDRKKARRVSCEKRAKKLYGAAKKAKKSKRAKQAGYERRAKR